MHHDAMVGLKHSLYQSSFCDTFSPPSFLPVLEIPLFYVSNATHSWFNRWSIFTIINLALWRGRKKLRRHLSPSIVNKITAPFTHNKHISSSGFILRGVPSICAAIGLQKFLIFYRWDLDIIIYHYFSPRPIKIHLW